MPSLIPLACTCCRTTYTRKTWRALRYVGIQHGVEGDRPLELRNCACGSTLAIEVEVRS